MQPQCLGRKEGKIPDAHCPVTLAESEFTILSTVREYVFKIKGHASPERQTRLTFIEHCV